MSHMNAKVDGYLRKNKKWQGELAALRKIILECPLTEEIKWRTPCYTHEERNIVLIGAFKEFCALSFVNGALLKDPKKLLLRPGEHTQAGRWIKFTNVQAIVAQAAVLKAYILEAIEVEKSGAKITLKQTADYKVPDELKKKWDEVPALKTAFEALTPGRQRGYLLYFSGAKQAQTREARIEKCMKQIFKGKGLND